MNTLGQFELFLAKGGRRKAVISLYKALWTRLLKNTEADLTKELLDSSLLTLHSQGRKPSYLNMIVNFARLYGQCFNQPELVNYPYFKKEKTLKSVMTDTEIEEFLALPPYVRTFKNRWGGISTATYDDEYGKYTLFYSILAFTGMRPVELAQMTTDRVELSIRVFRLREEDVKTHEPRLVPIPDRVYDQLYTYIKTLKSEYLFPSKNGGVDADGMPCMNAADWGYNFRQRLKRMGVKREGLTVYSLRHSLITRLLDEDVNLYKVQNLVGHKNIETTARYYHSSLKALKETVRKDPLANRGKTPQELFREMVKECQAISEKYYDFIYTDITISEDGNEMVLRRKIR